MEEFGYSVLILVLFVVCVCCGAGFLQLLTGRGDTYNFEGRRMCTKKCAELDKGMIEISNTYYCLCEGGARFHRNPDFYIP